MFPPPENRKTKKTSRNRHRKLFLTIAAAAFLLILIVFVIIIIPKDPAVLSGAEIPIMIDGSYAYTKEFVFYEDEGELVCVDFDGKKKWSRELPQSGMNIYANGKTVIAFNSKSVSVFTATGELMSVTDFYGSVMVVRASETMTAVMVQNSGGTPSIVLLDRKGVELKRETFEEKYLIDFGFYNNSLYYYTVDAEAMFPVSNILTVSEKLNSTGNVTVEGQMLQNILFRDNDLYAVGTNHIIKTDYLGKKLYEKLIYGWIYVDSYIAENGNPVMLFKLGGEAANTDQIFTIRVVSEDSADVYMKMPLTSVQVAIGNEKIYVFSKEETKIFDFSGKLIREQKFANHVTKIEVLPDTAHAIAFSGNRAFLITLPK